MQQPRQILGASEQNVRPQENGVARIIYALASWGLVLLGAVHIAATAVFYDSLTSQALWFLSGGLFMVSVAMLNLLNRAYGRVASGLRAACIGANVVVSVFAFTSAIVSNASPGESLLVLGILGPLVTLSMWPSALCEGSKPGAA